MGELAILICKKMRSRMANRLPHEEKQHWLFGLAACLWPVAFTLVGIFGSVPHKVAGELISLIARLR
jgi:hypothetical protein